MNIEQWTRILFVQIIRRVELFEAMPLRCIYDFLLWSQSLLKQRMNVNQRKNLRLPKRPKQFLASTFGAYY